MSGGFGALLDGDSVRYQAAQADVPGALWVFQHIPKTAGSSFGQEFGQRLQPAFNVHADHDDPRPARETLEISLASLLSALPSTRYRFVTGHLRGPQITRIQKSHGDTRLITMLREPFARVVSDYRYMRTPAHSRHAEAIARHRDFQAYVADPVSQNKMFRFLRRNPSATLAQTIEDLERRFTLVGTLDQYALCCRVLFRLLGAQGEPLIHANRTAERAENQIENLEHHRDQILRLNALDVSLYEHFACRLEAAAPRIQAWAQGTTSPS